VFAETLAQGVICKHLQTGITTFGPPRFFDDPIGGHSGQVQRRCMARAGSQRLLCAAGAPLFMISNT
ncbi:MAG: hypothetical protein ABJM15_09425, partial [Nitratireductor sp.]